MSDKKKVDSEEIIQRLKVGSPVLNEMRKDVVDFTTQFVSLVDDFEVFNSYEHQLSPHKKSINPRMGSGYRLEFETPNGVWRIDFHTDRTGRARRYGVEASYWLGQRGCVYSTDPDTKFSKDYVQQVRQALPVFIDGMIEIFPNILEECQPIMDAAPGFKKHNPNPGPYSFINDKYCLDCGKLGSYWTRDLEDCVPIKKLPVSC